MPPKSKEQKKFMQLALGVKEGEIGEDEVSQDVVDAAESMDKEELEKYAKGEVQELREVIRSIVQEEITEVPLDYTSDQLDVRRREEPDKAKFSRNQSEKPIGLVPFQAGNKSNRLSVKARCGEFLDLANEGGSANDWMKEEIMGGRPVGPPWLEMVYVESVNAWYVRGHEGRSRCKTIKELASKAFIEVPLDLFLRHKDTSEDRRASEISVSSLSREARKALENRVIPQFNSPIKSDDKGHIDLLVHDFEFSRL